MSVAVGGYFGGAIHVGGNRRCSKEGKLQINQKGEKD